MFFASTQLADVSCMHKLPGIFVHARCKQRSQNINIYRLSPVHNRGISLHPQLKSAVNVLLTMLIIEEAKSHSTEEKSHDWSKADGCSTFSGLKADPEPANDAGRTRCRPPHNSCMLPREVKIDNAMHLWQTVKAVVQLTPYLTGYHVTR